MTPAQFQQQINLEAFTDFDCSNRLRPTAIMQMMQDIATRHADLHHVGRDFNTAPRLGWVVVKYHWEFTNYPTSLDQLTLDTEFRGHHRMFVQRDFAFSYHGPCIGKATSIWSLFNLDQRKMVSPASTLPYPWMQAFSPRPDDLNFLAPVKFPSPELPTPDRQATYLVSYDDLDLHQHVNNVLYLAWALRPLDEEFRRKHSLNVLDMVFKKEITAGQKIKVLIKFLTSTHTLHLLQDEQGTVLAQVQGQWHPN
jgi:acyl-ACP thioesterase